jgi:hypothetical protein
MLVTKPATSVHLLGREVRHTSDQLQTKPATSVHLLGREVRHTSDHHSLKDVPALLEDACVPGGLVSRGLVRSIQV